MSVGRSLIAAYLIGSFLNLATLQLATKAPLAPFMISRGIVAIILSFGMLGLRQKSLRYSISRPTRLRIFFGGGGMALQIMSSSALPISHVALILRASPIFLAMILRQQVDFTSLTLLALIAITPFLLEEPSIPLGLGVGTMFAATLLIALSQRSQIEAARLEPPWVMPIAPALGMTLIGFFLLIFSGDHSILPLSMPVALPGLISGTVMTIAYWFAQALLSRDKKAGGTHMVLCDLSAAIAIGLIDGFSRRVSFSASLSTISVTLLVTLVFLIQSKHHLRVASGAHSK